MPKKQHSESKPGTPKRNRRGKPIKIRTGRAKAAAKQVEGTLPEARAAGLTDKDQQMEGNVELLHEKVRFALWCRSCNMSMYETSWEIATRFQCDPPPHSTICRWIAMYHKVADEDCVEWRNEIRRQQDLLINQTLRRWMPVVIADKFAMYRYEKADGEVIKVLDEEAFTEQLKAGHLVIKLLERQAKLWNLDLGEEKEGKTLTADSLGLLIIQQLNNLPAKQGGSIDIPTEVLELRAGNEPSIDEI